MKCFPSILGAQISGCQTPLGRQRIYNLGKKAGAPDGIRTCGLRLRRVTADQGVPCRVDVAQLYAKPRPARPVKATRVCQIWQMMEL